MNFNKFLTDKEKKIIQYYKLNSVDNKFINLDNTKTKTKIKRKTKKNIYSKTDQSNQNSLLLSQSTIQSPPQLTKPTKEVKRTLINMD